MLRFEAVSLRYGDLQVFNGLDLELAPARTTVLIGPSGCGKSTLLRLAIGLVHPDSGRVCFDGAMLRAEDVERVRRRAGYVIQEGGLFPHLSAARNVTLMARYLAWTPDRVSQRLEELSRLVQLPVEILSRHPDELSGGQRQRVSLMRALMLDPDLLLLDEPLGSLDPMIRYELQQDLRRIFARLGKTVVLVTHDLAEAAFFGDHIVLLRAGKIVQQGGVDEFRLAPADDFVRDFVRAQRLPFNGAPL